MDYKAFITILIISVVTCYGLYRLSNNGNKLRRVVYSVLIVDLLLLAWVMYTKSYYFPGVHIIIIWCLGLFTFIAPSLFVVGIFSAFVSIVSSTVNRLPWISQKLLPHSKARTNKYRLVRLILSEEEEENIIGDLLEEYSQYQSKLKAYWWLVGQIFKSVIPLIYKALKKAVTDKLAAWIS